MSAEGRAELLRALHRPGDAIPSTTEVIARVGWSLVAEPGDAVAGALVDGLGAERSLALVAEAVRAGAAGAGGSAGGTGSRGVAGAVSEPGGAGGPGGADGAGTRTILDAAEAAGMLAADDRAGFADALRAGFARWQPRLASLDVVRSLEAGAAVGARLHVPGDPSWPAGFLDLGPHAPFVLWSRSREPIVLGDASVAIVGSRANTTYGAEVAAELAAGAVDAGLIVVSGGAYGIDAVAHRVAVAAHGRTIAVLAGGIDQFYPSGNTELLRTVTQRGAVVAESAPGVRPTRWRFLARNRLIAALGGSVTVVEAGARSGALNTAHHAAQLGRPVFAVPGPVTSASSTGCHRLVAGGRAELLVGLRDPLDAVLRPMDDQAGAQAVLRGATDDPELVRALDALGRSRPIPLAEVARRSGLSTGDAADALALAELQARVVRSGDGWVLTAA